MMKLLIANWKASINKSETSEWLTTFLNYVDTNNLDAKLAEKDTTIVICPPFPLISTVSEQLEIYQHIKTGSQTISTVGQGAFTGEVTAELLKHYVQFAIIGHSERRKQFNETEEKIAEQIENCTSNGISSILCVRNEQDKIYPGVTAVAYEPVDAIGSGHNAPIEDVIAMKQKLTLPENTSFIYGGSVDEQNIASYLQSGEIDGFLVGTASLHADSFIKLVEVMI